MKFKFKARSKSEIKKVEGHVFTKYFDVEMDPHILNTSNSIISMLAPISWILSHYMIRYNYKNPKNSYEIICNNDSKYIYHRLLYLYNYFYMSMYVVDNYISKNNQRKIIIRRND